MSQPIVSIRFIHLYQTHNHDARCQWAYQVTNVLLPANLKNAILDNWIVIQCLDCHHPTSCLYRNLEIRHILQSSPLPSIFLPWIWRTTKAYTMKTLKTNHTLKTSYSLANNEFKWSTRYDSVKCGVVKCSPFFVCLLFLTELLSCLLYWQ
jgi:hypothetical protein